MEKQIKWYHLTGTRNRLTWTALILISFVATMGSAIENSWFNTFVFDSITPQPQAVAWMVSGSAITAALAAILFGAISDRYRGRMGRRKLFILIGLPIAGLFTILFPLGALIKSAEMAVAYVVAADCLMMIGFGAAYDGVLSGYITDITTVNNRGRVQGILQIVGGVGTLVTSVIAGITIDKFGYQALFTCIGVAMILVGISGGLMLQDQPVARTEEDKHRKPLLSEILENFRWNNIVANKNLFALLIAVLIWGSGWYAATPYLLVYAMRYLGFSASQLGLAQAVPLIAGMLLAIPAGSLSDKWGRKKTSILLLIIMTISPVILGLVKPGASLTTLVLALVLLMAPMTAWYINYKSWARDLFPEGKKAQFAGLTVVFVITLPMIIGSNIGSFVISTFGTPIVVNGEAGFVPTPVLLFITAAITLLSIIPILLIKHDRPARLPQTEDE